MPQLDGVSATVMIREVNPRIPIIAMTSNINQQDLDMYFHWGELMLSEEPLSECTDHCVGMRDVLAKPFTKEGMIGKLRRHLASFMRNPPPPDALMDPTCANGGQPPTPGPYSNPNMTLPLSAASSSGMPKFETTPIQSPATSASWHSPAQLPHTSPNLNQDHSYLTAGGGAQMAMTPGGTAQARFPNPMLPAMTSHQGHQGHHGRISDAMTDAPPEKRQRVQGPGYPGHFQQ